jgi:stage V sporulation protein K
MNKNNNQQIKSNDKIWLIPQNNKYITINNKYITPTNQTNIPNTPQKINRIVVRRPVDNGENNKTTDDQFINQLMGTLLNGGNNLFTNNIGLVTKKKEEVNTEIIVKKIDRENLIYLDEKPKNLIDLLELCKKISNEYDPEKYYNIDLKILKKLEAPLVKLNKLIGLEDVKNKIIDIILYYLQRLDITNFDMLHTIIDGAPGTGKTEIAHIYCEILNNLGVLSKGTFKKAKKHDLIGGYLGHTAMKTMKVLEECKGGVLFIDEIYSLGSSNGKESKDIYAKECIDLIMEFLSENKSDFVLVVAGYKNDIEQFFLTMNDGLERRFPIHLSIGEYNAEEMEKIFHKKVDELKWNIESETIPKDFFSTEKDYFKFFGGDMETLLSKCKYAHSRNLLEDHTKEHRIISRKDFIDGFELYKKNPEIESRKKSPKYLNFYL